MSKIMNKKNRKNRCQNNKKKKITNKSNIQVHQNQHLSMIRYFNSKKEEKMKVLPSIKRLQNLMIINFNNF